MEEYQYGTDPWDGDSDGDGLPDGWEVQYGFNPLNNSDATVDGDGDGLSNLEEYQYGTDPTVADSDGDGYDDGYEVSQGTDPLDSSSYPTTTTSQTQTSLYVYIGVVLFLVAVVGVFAWRILSRHGLKKT